MQKEINFYQEKASEHRLQEYSKGPVPLYLILNKLLKLNKTCNYHITFIIISKLLHDILIIAIYNKGFIFI